MNRKFYLGVGLLAGLLIGCVFVGKGVENVQNPVSRYVEAATTGDLDSGVQYLARAQQLWEKYKKRLASISDHGPMDEIDTALAETIRYGKSGLKEEFLAGCEKLKILLRSLATDHKLTWWNLLGVGISRFLPS